MPRKSWWARLPFGVRMAAGIGALLILIGGGAAGVAALATRDNPRIVTTVGQPAAAAPRTGHEAAGLPPLSPAAPPRLGAQATIPRTSDEADRLATRTPRRTDGRRADTPVPAAAAAAVPVAPPSAAPAEPIPTTVTRTETQTREIPFQTRLVRDPSLARGTKRIQTPGIPGEETLRYQVTVVGGQVTDRRLLDTTVTREPQHRVVAFGAGRDADAGRRRGCGRTLDVCVPLGRAAVCPGDDKAGRDGDREEESAVQLGGSVTVLDRDVELLDVGDLDAIEGMAGC